MMTVFSKIASGELPSYKVAEDDNFFAFLDIRPLTAGHTLVVPRKTENDYLFSLDNETYSGLLLFAKRVAAALEKAVPCRRIGMMVLGMEVPHAHIHLVPLQKESDMNLINKKLNLSPEEMQAIAEKIFKNFS
ncbi:MAG: HIT family protein [Prevotellaceae bacterium]|nr:HIT family protein [Prevotellaceae bacterium]